MNDFSVTLFSNDSMSIYPENEFASFTNKLFRPLELEGDDWSVAITELYVDNNRITSIGTHCFINTEIIKPRHVGSQYTRCLRVFHIDGGFEVKRISRDAEDFFYRSNQVRKFLPEFLPIENNFIDEISILLTDEDGEKIKFANQIKGSTILPTYATLQFRRPQSIKA